MRELREAWGAKIGLSASNWMLEIGTFFFAERIGAYVKEPPRCSWKTSPQWFQIPVPGLACRRSGPRPQMAHRFGRPAKLAP